MSEISNLASLNQVPAPRFSMNRVQAAHFADDEARSEKLKASGQSEEMSFWDMLDVINPLQHIPGISTIYRAVTGDEIKGAAKIMGGAIFGGPIGFMAGLMDATVTDATGKDPIELAYNMVTGKDDDAPAALAVNDQTKADEESAMAQSDAEPARYAIHWNAERTAVADEGEAPVSVAESASSSQDALRQLAADLRSGADVDKAQNAKAGPSDFIKSLRSTAPEKPSMPVPGRNFLPAQKSPVIEIRPHKTAASVQDLNPDLKGPNAAATAPQPVDQKQIAEKMIQALEQYQKMQGLNSNSLPRTHLPGAEGLNSGF